MSSKHKQNATGAPNAKAKPKMPVVSVVPSLIVIVGILHLPQHILMRLD